MDVEGGMEGPGFLAPIPEDVSVAASQHAVNLSTVSAVASSDSGDLAAPSADIVKKKQKRRGRRRRKQDGDTDPARMIGGGAIADNVSDANASLGGANEHDLEMISEVLPQSSKGPKVEDETRKPVMTPKCKKWSLTLMILAFAIGIGMYIILVKVPRSGDGNVPTLILTTAPTPSPVFASMEVDFSTDAPTSPPVYSPEEVKILDDAFLKVSGTTIGNILNMNTPEGKGRDWMINSDTRMNINEEQRVQQRYIMSVLHFATNGDFWNKKFDWLNPEKSECEWYGITCNSNSVNNIIEGKDNTIEGIDLSENNVTGTLPDAITSLSNLVTLNMSHDSISGTIPGNFFGLLDQLETIDMEKNQIFGSIPEIATSISKSRLRFLNLESNELTGTFPFFPNVEFIRFGFNNLTSIDGRYSTSSPSLKQIRGLHNMLSGSLPTSWDLPNLIQLDLAFNFLTGTIPQELWNLPSLKTLWLDHNNIGGTLADNSDSHSLRRLWLDSNFLSGTIPLNFGWNWTKLYSVKLQNNLLSGSVSPEQCNRWNGLNLSSWIFDADCQIDCACCTGTNCA